MFRMTAVLFWIFFSYSGSAYASNTLFGGTNQLESGLRMVQSTGRAVIQDADAVSEAREMALEDALYYAALKGGAKIDGYSAVDEQTALSETIIVRPATEILDYHIISEIQDDTHYEIIIEAVIGDMTVSGCQNRPVSHITLFKPAFKLGHDVPNWLSQSPAYMVRKLAVNLSNQSQLRVQDARHTQAAEAQYGDRNLYDYRTLTSGRVAMKNGDIGVVTTVQIEMDSTRKLLSKTHFMDVMLTSSFLSASGQMMAENIEDSFRIRLSQDHMLRTVSVLSHEKREVVASLLADAVDIHAAKLADKLICMPLRDTLKRNKDALYVDVGAMQGVTRNHIAVAKGLDNPMTFLKVTSTDSRMARLMPLDNRIDASRLEGLEVTFLEFDK